LFLKLTWVISLSNKKTNREILIKSVTIWKFFFLFYRMAGDPPTYKGRIWTGDFAALEAQQDKHVKSYLANFLKETWPLYWPKNN
jgi:hypothetical protein